MVLSMDDEMATSDLISILLEEALENKMSDVYILYKRYGIPSVVKLAIDGEYVMILSSLKTENVIQYIIRESFNNYKNLNSASSLRSLCIYEEIHGNLKQRINNTWYDVKVACKSDSSNMVIRFSILQRIGNHSFPESMLPITVSLQSSELYCEEEQIPILLKGSIDAIEECAGKIRKAQRKQHFARNEAETAIEYAKAAQNEADEACKASAKLGHRKEAIEKLQKSEEKMADALVRAVEAQKKSVESQMALNEVQQYQLEQQKKLIELSKGLLALGTINKAANDKVIKALKDTLKGASEVDLDDFTRAELESVLQQLSEQQDIFYRLDKLDENYVKMAEAIRENRKRIIGMQNVIAEHDELIERTNESLDKLDENYVKMAEAIRENRKRIIGMQNVIAEHDELIERMNESLEKLSIEYAEKRASIQQTYSEEVNEAQMEVPTSKEEPATIKGEFGKTKSNIFLGISLGVSVLALIVSFVTLVQSLL